MLKRYYQVVGSFLVGADCVGLVAAWLLAYYLRFYTQIVPVTKGIPPFSRYVTLTIPVAFIWVVVFRYHELYGTQRIVRRTSELGAVLRAHLIAMLAFLAVTYVFTEYRFSRVVIGYFGVISGFYLLAIRLLLRNTLRRLRSMGQWRNSVLVGTGDTAMALLERVRRVPELGIRIVGFFTKDGVADSMLPAPVLGSYAEVSAKTAGRKDLQQIVLALPRADGVFQDEILKSLSDTVVDLYLLPDIHEYTVIGCTVENFDDLAVLTLNRSSATPVGFFWKRLFDLIGAGIGLFLLSPLLLFLALLVKLTSRGPIFYGQERMGLDGRTFKMWKFRSMRVGAENETGAVWAKKNDDRRTPIGALLRSTSLDELPQLWNALVGDMSLVGPRPERPEFVGQFRGKIPKYMLRHKMKAGITGWAQVNGWRGDTSLEKRIECDLFYIRHWSIFFDIKILLLTIWKGFVNKNAY